MLDASDLILISVDDHIIEPPDLFVHHLDAEVPGSGTQAGPQRRRLRCLDLRQGGHGDRRPQRGGRSPQGGVRPRAAEPRRGPARLLRGQRAGQGHGCRGRPGFDELPSFPTFTARVFASDDPDLSLALVRAYNDWHIDEWCGAQPGRFIPMAVPVIWDPEQTADEIRRAAAKGCHSLSFTENPAALGYPSFHDEYWDPVWRACCDTGTVVSIHLGSSGRLSIPAVDSPPDVMITLQPMNIQSAAADLLWSRVLKNFPASGWRCPKVVPDGSRTSSTGSTGPSRCTTPGPSRTSVAGSPPRCSGSTSSPASSATRWAWNCAARIGVDNMAWEADYPHSDSMWPTAPEELNAVFTDNAVPDGEIGKMTHENAMRWYSFDPFVHVPREEATVGALRRRAQGHDVSTMSRSTRVRTPDEKLEGFRRGPAGRWPPSKAADGARRTPRRRAPRAPLDASPRWPATSHRARRRHRARGVRERPGRRRVAPVMASSNAAWSARLRLLFREEFEVAGRDHPHRLAEVGEQRGEPAAD